MTRRGYTLIELVLVLFLLLFIALAVFSLTRVGSEAYLRMSEKQAVQADLRVGISYMDVKLRQNDTIAAVRLAAPPFTAQAYTEQDVLLITYTLGDQPYELWVYVYDGYLRELPVSAGAGAAPDMGLRIVRMDDLDIRVVSDDALQIRLARINQEGTAIWAERLMTLRTGGLAP